MRHTLFFRGTTGLNTKVSPVRLKYDPETGMQELAEAVNVDIDQTGRVSRRKGMRKILTKTAPHSFWNIQNQQACYFVSEGTLYRMTPGNIVGLKTGLDNGSACYCEVGIDVYFNNGTDLGKLKEGHAWEDWAQTPYVGPDTTREYSGPPLGSKMCHYNGRIYVAQGEFVLCSEPFNYGCFDQGRNFLPLSGSQIIDMVVVTGGIYISTNEGIYFAGGPDFLEMDLRKVVHKPVVPGTMTQIDSGVVGSEAAGLGAIFTVQGIGVVLGTGSGQVSYLTKDRLNFGNFQYGFAAVNLENDNEYICLMEV